MTIFLKKDIDFSEITDWHEVTTTAGLINHIYKSNQIMYYNENTIIFFNGEFLCTV